MATSNGSGNLTDKVVRLAIRKGSLFIPLVVLLGAVLTFVVAVSGDGEEQYLDGVLTPGKLLSWYEKEDAQQPTNLVVLDGPTDLYGYMAEDRPVTVCKGDLCTIAGPRKCSSDPGGQTFCKLNFSVRDGISAKLGYVDYSPNELPRVMVCEDSDRKSCSPKQYDACGSTPGVTSPCKINFSRIDEGLKIGVSKRKDGWDKVVRPFMKMLLVQLGHDTKDIIRNIFSTTWQLALFSIVPGLAGLFYRRQFMPWFLATFAVLLAINASGWASLTSAEPMPLSGKLLLFVAVQVLLLLAVFRLQRHSQGLGALWSPLAFISPKWHNRVLKWILIIVGVSLVGHSLKTSVMDLFGAGSHVGTSRTGATKLDPSQAGAASVGSGGAPTMAVAASSGAGTAATTASSRSTDGAQGGPMSLLSSVLGGGAVGWLLKWELILVGLPLIYSLFRNTSPWPSLRNKNIVICLDGTSNTPDQIEMGFIAQTNVYKLFDMLRSDHRDKAYEPVGEFGASLCKKYNGKVEVKSDAILGKPKEAFAEQIGFYYAGVGNKYDNNPILSLLGMATGMGANEIVERAYLDLIRVYRPGDRVFITGFSRGAAIARLLARAIDARKAPRSVWTLYFLGKHRILWISRMRKEIPITVLGCWDTVGAFGVAKTVFGINFQSMNMGLDLTVPDNVQQAYHMLALDEHRDSFEPTLMDPDPIRPERIVEIWFPGDHANIGGGWATDKLSDVTLDFLLSRISSGYANEPGKTPGDPSWGVYLKAVKADKEDVAVREFTDRAVPTVDPEPGGQLRQWVSRLYIYRPRTLPLHAVISDAVFERMEQVKPAYAPEALAALNTALAKQRTSVTQNVELFKQTQSMTTSEQDKVLEANTRLRLLRSDSYSTDVKWKVAVRYDIPSRVDEEAKPGRPMQADVLREKVTKRVSEIRPDAPTVDDVMRKVRDAVIMSVVDRVIGHTTVLDNGWFNRDQDQAVATGAGGRRAAIDGAVAQSTNEMAIDAAIEKIVVPSPVVRKMVAEQIQMPATVGAGEVPSPASH